MDESKIPIETDAKNQTHKYPINTHTCPVTRHLANLDGLKILILPADGQVSQLTSPALVYSCVPPRKINST